MVSQPVGTILVASKSVKEPTDESVESESFPPWAIEEVRSCVPLDHAFDRPAPKYVPFSSMVSHTGSIERWPEVMV